MSSPFDAPPAGGASELPPPPPSGPAPPPASPAPPPPPPPVPSPPPPTVPDAAARRAADPAAEGGAPPPASPSDHDLDDLLGRLHDEMDREASAPRAVGSELTDARDLERPERETVVVETDGGIHFDPRFAGFPARFAGFVIDSVVIGLSVAPGLVLMTTRSLPLVLLGLVVAIAGFLAVISWAARSIASTGRWIGNRVTKTNIVDTRTGRNLTTSSAAGRMVIRHVVSPIFFIGFFPAFVDPQRRTLHDRVATSIVITRPREVWTAGQGAGADGS